MAITLQKPTDVAKKFVKVFFKQRNIFQLSNYISDTARLYFSDIATELSSKAEITEYLENNDMSHMHIIDESYDSSVYALSEIIYAKINTVETVTATACPYWFTFIFKTDEPIVQLVHVHISINKSGLDMDSIVSSHTAQQLQNTIVFEKILPCGFVIARFDDNFTIIDASNSFYKLFEYEKNDYLCYSDSLLYPINAEYVLDTARNFSMQKNYEYPSSVEFCAVTKTGYDIWIKADITSDSIYIDSAHKRALYCIFSDITQIRESEIKLKIEKEKYRIISEISEDVNFEYDEKTDTMYFDKTYNTYFPNRIVHDLKNTAINGKVLHKEDIPLFLKIHNHIVDQKAENYTSDICLNIDGKGDIWFNLRIKRFHLEENNSDKIFGKLINIDRQKKENERLIAKAKLDPLTKLYNKTVTENEISSYLKNYDGEMLGAMFIVDVDNFKAVNDNFGHLFGDAVLVKAAKTLKSLFRNTDITGRIGGDEFLVFMKDVLSNDIIIEKAKLLCSELCDSFENGNITINISASIGIAITNDNMQSFRMLFKAADTALYTAKSNGKNQYQLYCPSISKKPRKQLSMRGSVPDGALVTTFFNDLGIRIFELLYQSDDIRASIEEALDIMLYSFGVSRMYIYMFSHNAQRVSCEFEKCTEDVTPNMKMLRSMPVNSTYDIFNLFDSAGVFYCNDTALLDEPWNSIYNDNNAKSILQYMMYYHGTLTGYIGFDDCNVKRMWQKSEIDALALMSKIINEYLIKIYDEYPGSKPI